MMTATKNMKAMGMARAPGLLLASFAVMVLSNAAADAAVTSGKALGWGDNCLVRNLRWDLLWYAGLFGRRFRK